MHNVNISTANYYFDILLGGSFWRLSSAYRYPLAHLIPPKVTNLANDKDAKRQATRGESFSKMYML